MNNKQENLSDWEPRLPESFVADFKNARFEDIRDGLSTMGFRFQRSLVEGDDQGIIVIEGESREGDGTKIEVRITKGPDYKSPAEKANSDKKE